MQIEDEIKGRFRNERHKGLINLTFTVKQLSYSFLLTLKTHGLTEPQYNILRVLSGFRNEGPSSIGFLKERMLDRSSDLSRLVDKLYEKGLIDRKENYTDRRQKDLVITDKGIRLLNEMRDCENQVDALLHNLTDEEVIELNRLLDKIRDQINNKKPNRFYTKNTAEYLWKMFSRVFLVRVCAKNQLQN